MKELTDGRLLAIALTVLTIVATVAVASTMQGDDNPSGLAYGLAKGTLAIGLLVLMDRVIFRSIDFVDEVYEGNIAAAIVYASLALLIGLCVSGI